MEYDAENRHFFRLNLNESDSTMFNKRIIILIITLKSFTYLLISFFSLVSFLSVYKYINDYHLNYFISMQSFFTQIILTVTWYRPESPLSVRPSDAYSQPLNFCYTTNKWRTTLHLVCRGLILWAIYFQFTIPWSLLNFTYTNFKVCLIWLLPVWLGRSCRNVTSVKSSVLYQS